MSTRRTQRLVVATVALSLLAVACSDEAREPPVGTGAAASTDVPDATRAPADSAAEAPEVEGDEAVPETTARDEPAETHDTDDAPMTVTVDLDPDAVWEDGTPVTVTDLECTWRAALNTPGSILRDQGYDRITGVSEGASDRQAVIEFGAVYAPYKTLFDRIIKASAVGNCDDISGDFSTELPISGGGLQIDSWSPEQMLLVPNEASGLAGVPRVQQVVITPIVDPATELALLESGQVDFIYPQFDGSLPTELADPNIAVQIASGDDYEALYFQQRDGPFADPVFREAFSKSIDRQALYTAIYQPIFAAAGIEGALLNCGPVVDGPYCPAGNFESTFDPTAADALLTGDGWVKDSSGFWSKNGVVPEIRWMVNDGAARREGAQSHLIPLLAAAGFHVVADNCDFRCVFLQRLPTLDYDLAMYVSRARPDPSYLTPQFTCDQVPTEQNSFQGRNQVGWCNQEASDALYLADATLDPQQRVNLVEGALRAMETDHVLLPLVNFPAVGAWRTDRLGGPVGAALSNERAFDNIDEWTDLDGDGRIVIGAEQWPSCLNPVTACADSFWYAWTVSGPTLPGIWRATADHAHEITDLVVGEPTVEVAG